jgi:hypothetical protein
MPTSQNGWSANDITQTDVQLIPGTARKLRLRKGDAGWLLRRILSFIDQNVENIDEPTQDDWGYAERPIRGSSTTLSNHASGTATDANATRHPLGVRGTWSAAERVEIHEHLKAYVDPVSGRNVIRWGDDYTGRVDGMHFEIVGTPAAVARVAAKLRGAHATPPPVQDTPKTERETIRYWSIQNGCGQKGSKAPAMRTIDLAFEDCAQFIAWGQSQGATDDRQRQGWHDAVVRDSRYEYGAAILTDIVRRTQRKFGLVADGVFGPKTAAVMARFGYKII